MSLFTPEIIGGIVTILVSVTGIIWRVAKFITNYVDRTTADLRIQLKAATIDRDALEKRIDEERDLREMLQKELSAESVRASRLEDQVKMLAMDLARIRGQLDERETVMTKQAEQLQIAHEKNGTLKHASELSEKESKKVAESKDKLITKITAERDKLATKLDEANDLLKTTRELLEAANHDKLALTEENRKLKAAAKPNVSTSQSGALDD